MAHSSLLLFFLVLTTLASTSNSTNITATFFFGDSLVDTGNNNFLPTFLRADHFPYGQDFPCRVATGRFSNGLLIPDLLNAKLGIKNLLPPYLDPRLKVDDLKTGVNFASAGSGYDEVTSTLIVGSLPVPRQIKNFEEYVGKLKAGVGNAEAARVIGGSLAVFVSASNDIVVNFLVLPTKRRTQFNLTGYQDFLLQLLEESIKKLYAQGVRKYIAAGLPPILCFPALSIFCNNLTGKCFCEQISISTTYNDKLKILISKFQQSLQDSKILYLDLHDSLLDIINNPNKYGLVQTRRGCCGLGFIDIGPLCTPLTPTCANANGFAFFDALHPTEPVYKIITDQIMQKLIPQFPVKDNAWATIESKASRPVLRL